MVDRGVAAHREFDPGGYVVNSVVRKDIIEEDRDAIIATMVTNMIIKSQFGIGGQNKIMYEETYNALLVLAFLEDCLITDYPNFEEMNNTYQSLPEDQRLFLESLTSP